MDGIVGNSTEGKIAESEAIEKTLSERIEW